MYEEKAGDSRRNLIYKEAVRMIAERGFAATSVRDICKAVGIKESSFYIYFSKKEEILSEVFSEFEALFLKAPVSDEQIASLTDEFSPRRILVEALSLCFGRLRDESVRRLWRVVIVEQFCDERAACALRSVNRRLAETAGGLFEQWRRRGFLDNPEAVVPAAEFFAASVRMLFYDCLSRGGGTPPPEEIERLAAFFLSVLKVRFV